MAGPEELKTEHSASDARLSESHDEAADKAEATDKAAVEAADKVTATDKAAVEATDKVAATERAESAAKVEAAEA
ncbi:MAG TPA: hypothetical protein VIA18_29345, partial [Polyangia bacterium]|nr:hypothetical protein [Polyangia bacterium]